MRSQLCFGLYQFLREISGPLAVECSTMFKRWSLTCFYTVYRYCTVGLSELCCKQNKLNNATFLAALHCCLLGSFSTFNISKCINSRSHSGLKSQYQYYFKDIYRPYTACIFLFLVLLLMYCDKAYMQLQPKLTV